MRTHRCQQTRGPLHKLDAIASVQRDSHAPYSLGHVPRGKPHAPSQGLALGPSLICAEPPGLSAMAPPLRKRLIPLLRPVTKAGRVRIATLGNTLGWARGRSHSVCRLIYIRFASISGERSPTLMNRTFRECTPRA